MIINQKAKKRTSKQTKDILFFLLLVVWPILQFSVFYIFVNINSFRMAFVDQSGKFTFDNFKIWFTLPEYKMPFLNGLKKSGIFFLINVGFSIPLALLFSYYIYSKLHGSAFFKVVLFLPNILSSIVMVILYSYFMNDALPDMLKDFFNLDYTLRLNSIDNKSDILILLFNIWFGFGTTVLIFSNSMGSISPSLNEAMKLDGASSLREFWSLIIPCIWPTISMFIVTNIAGILSNQYNIMSFFPEGYEGTLGYYLFAHVQGFRTNPDAFELHKFAALGLISTAITIPLTFGIKKLLEKLGPRVD